MTSGPDSAASLLAGVRPLVRKARKRAKRAGSAVSSAALRLQNATSRRSILGSTPVVVSLTSYGQRIQDVAVAIESIARGSSRPERLILWLDDPTAFASLPEALQRLQRRGLEVRLTENLGPHTKYFPYVHMMASHELPMVTADDDIIYPRRWLRELHAAHVLHPEDVNCFWASEIKVDRDQLAGYLSWPNCRDTQASFAHFALGVSGVIYPPAMLTELARRGTAFRASSPSADDVWLHWVALRSGVRVRQLGPVPRHFPIIPGSQETALMQTNNIAGAGNDAWIRGLYTNGDVTVISETAHSPARFPHTQGGPSAVLPPNRLPVSR